MRLRGTTEIGTVQAYLLDVISAPLGPPQLEAGSGTQPLRSRTPATS